MGTKSMSLMLVLTMALKIQNNEIYFHAYFLAFVGSLKFLLQDYFLTDQELLLTGFVVKRLYFVVVLKDYILSDHFY